MTSSAKIRLHVVSPIHIGCGEVYEPTSFRVDSAAGKLYAFDPLDLLDSLDDVGKKSLEKVCSGDDLLAIIKHVSRLSSAGKVPPLSAVNMAKGLLTHYETVLGMTTYKKEVVINQFTLERTAYNHNGGFPYIPGSSIKGAIRTAYLSYKNEGKQCNIADTRKMDREVKELEKRLLGGAFENDPFRLLKVTDLLPVNQPSTQLLYAVNVRKKGGGKGPFQILETIVHGSIFEGFISISQPPSGAKVVALPAIKDLMRHLSSFCLARYGEDKEVMGQIEADSFSKELGGRIDKLNRAIHQETAFLIRLGRHGGAESHTLDGDGVRKINVKQQDNTYKVLDHATTIWLAAEGKEADEGMPFGWAMLEMLSVDDGVNTCCDELRNQQARETGARRAEVRLKAEEEAARRDAEEIRLRKIEEENLRREEEARRRKEEWESLSEEERLVSIPELADVTEQQVVECFNKLDSLSSAYREKLAESIKRYYIKTGKWEGGSKKQGEKVKKLKAILGG